MIDKKITLGLVILVSLGALIYSNTFSGPFHLDDLQSIASNPSIKNLGNFSAIWNFWPMRFVTYLSIALNYHFGQFDVFGYHLFNLIVHLASAILVWWLVYLTVTILPEKDKKIRQQAGLIGFFSGLIFVAHPIQTQGVTYIIQRAVALATFFYLLSFCCYIKVRVLQQASGGQREIRLYYIGSLAAAVLAMFSKEMAITLPFMILLYEFYFLKKRGDFRWKTILPFMLTVLIIPLTMWLTRSVDFFKMQRVQETITHTSPVTYLLTEFRVLITYIRLVFLPINQNFDYDYPLSSSLLQPSVLISLLVLIVIIISAIRMRLRFRLVSFGILWFLITLIPESSLIPIKDVIFEHRLYLPLAGYALVIASGVFYLSEKKGMKLAVLVLSCLVAIYAVKAHLRNNVWKSEMALWNDVILKSPGKDRGYNYRGFTYLSDKNALKAIADFDLAFKLNPKSSEAINNRGNANKELGNFDQAIADYTQAIEIAPDDGDYYYNRGNIYQQKGELDQAIADYNRAIEHNTIFDPLYFSLGNAWKDKGNLDQAIAAYSKAIEKNPLSAAAYNNRAAAYLLTRQYDKCRQDVEALKKLGQKAHPKILEMLKEATSKQD